MAFLLLTSATLAATPGDATRGAREYPAANEGQAATVRPIGDVLFGAGSTMIRFAGAVLAMDCQHR